ncbi:hypothetical protein CEXT_458871 [Caerostris extrusa]|uniref:Uncharacterized protein n=1 Tax=Caerostris extrusa TaxID=172846 RepID=A0AAV4PLT6_CAEEX|nr:hypothetical protein CEXT_458871 [Caerostris extrusa]
MKQMQINNVDWHNEIPFYYACWKQSIMCVELLLKMGAKIHISQSGREPLHEVQNARHCSLKLVQILLQKILRWLHHFMQPRLEITQFV